VVVVLGVSVVWGLLAPLLAAAVRAGWLNATVPIWSALAGRRGCGSGSVGGGGFV